MAARGSHLADAGNNLLEESVFTTHSPAAVRLGGSRQIIAAVPSATAGLQQDMVSKSAGSRPALLQERPRAQKRRDKSIL